MKISKKTVNIISAVILMAIVMFFFGSLLSKIMLESKIVHGLICYIFILLLFAAGYFGFKYREAKREFKLLPKL